MLAFAQVKYFYFDLECDLNTVDQKYSDIGPKNCFVTAI